MRQAPRRWPSRPDCDLVAAHEALLAFETVDARAAKVVELRFFGGLQNDEVALALGVSLATVKRDWTVARGPGCSASSERARPAHRLASFRRRRCQRRRTGLRCARAGASGTRGSRRRWMPAMSARATPTKEPQMIIKKLLALLLALFTAVAFAAVDVNNADATQLDAVKGIGPTIAGRITAERKKAPFKDWNDLIARVSGIGEKSAAKLSEGGLTVNGSTYNGVAAKPAAAVRDGKPAGAAPAPAVAAAPPASAAMTRAEKKAAAKEAKEDKKAAAAAAKASDAKTAKK